MAFASLPRDVLCTDILKEYKVQTLDDVFALRKQDRSTRQAILPCITEIEYSPERPTATVENILSLTNLVRIEHPIRIESWEDIRALAKLPKLRRAVLDLGPYHEAGGWLHEAILKFIKDHREGNFTFYYPFGEVSYTGPTLCILYEEEPDPQWDPIKLIRGLNKLTPIKRFVGSGDDAKAFLKVSKPSLEELVIIPEDFDSLLIRSEVTGQLEYNLEGIKKILRNTPTLTTLGFNLNSLSSANHWLFENPLKELGGPYPNITRFDYPYYLHNVHDLASLIKIFPNVKEPLLYPRGGFLLDQEKGTLDELKNYFNGYRYIPYGGNEDALVKELQELGYSARVDKKNYFSIIDC